MIAALDGIRRGDFKSRVGKQSVCPLLCPLLLIVACSTELNGRMRRKATPLLPLLSIVALYCLPSSFAAFCQQHTKQQK